MMKAYLTPLALALVAGPVAFSAPALAGDMSGDMGGSMSDAQMMGSAVMPYMSHEAKAAIESGTPVLLHFVKKGCPVCAAQTPTVESFLQQHDGIKAYRVDFDADKDADKAYGVTMQSALILFRNGKEIARSSGETDAGKLNMLLGQLAG